MIGNSYAPKLTTILLRNTHTFEILSTFSFDLSTLANQLRPRDVDIKNTVNRDPNLPPIVGKCTLITD